MLRVILILLSVFILTDHSGSAITSHRVQEQLINCKGYYILFLSQYIILLETVKNIKTVEIIIGVIVIIFPILFNPMLEKASVWNNSKERRMNSKNDFNKLKKV